MARAALPLPDEAAFKRGLSRRHWRGRLGRRFFLLAVAAGIVALLTLLGSIANNVAGYRAIRFNVDPNVVTGGRPLESLTADELTAILAAHVNLNRERVLLRDRVIGAGVDPRWLTTAPVRELLAGKVYPPELAELTLRDLSQGDLGRLLAANLGVDGLIDLINDEVIGLEVVRSWTLLESLIQRPAIEAVVAAEYPDARLEFRTWLTLSFLTRPMSATPAEAGIRTALLGTLWLIAITLAVAFPVGVGAAIYLEEYAGPSRLNRLIETNIRNLAGVPSIIYGLLGLAIFVRALGDVTGGRSVLSGGLTMALLILPLIIINAQEALRAVPASLREASYGLGATRWQTIWRAVLPAAMSGILTGAILATSRAIGETAPLLVIGASTFIAVDPGGPLSKFTALPIQIYDWTKRPDPQFRDIAASTIVVLLILLLTLNAAAILVRRRYSRKLQA